MQVRQIDIVIKTKLSILKNMTSLAGLSYHYSRGRQQNRFILFKVVFSQFRQVNSFKKGLHYDMYMIVERQYMDVKNILYLHKYLCRFSFKIRKEKKSLMVWEAALLASKAKINVFQKQNLNGAVPIIWNLDIFSPFWRVVKLLYLVVRFLPLVIEHNHGYKSLPQ